MYRSFSMLAICLASLLVPFGSASASRVSPMSAELEPFGRQSIVRIQYSNTADREFPVEVRAFRGEISEDGELTLVPADDDFLIFPAQQIITPLGEQIFRAQYVGEPDIDEARVYYLSMQQLPVELEDGPPQVQVTVNFNVFVSVEPDGLAPLAKVTEAAAETRDDVSGVVVRIANEGKGMLLASRQSWVVKGRTMSGEAFEVDFNPAEIGNKIGVGVVAPGKARRFFVPLEFEVEPQSVSVELK